MKKNRLPKFQLALLYSGSAVLWLSGAAWLCFQQPSESTWPAQLMKLHGAAAMLFLVLFGSLLGHVKAGWAAKRNRLSGSVLIGTVSVLSATGWGLYYLGDERIRHAISLAHAALGLSLALLMTGHIFLGRRSRP